MAEKPPASKEAVVVVWDVGTYMKTLGARATDECRAAIAELLIKKIQYSKQDEVGVVLGGTQKTHNSLASTYPGEYANISVISPIAKPTPEGVRNMGKVEVDEVGGSQMDLLNCLIVACDLLNNRVGKLRFRKRIFLFTAAGDDVEKTGDLENLITSMAQHSISLVVVGVDLKYPSPEAAAADEDWDRMSTKQQNEKVLYHITETVKQGSVVTPISTALQRLTDLATKTTLQRTTTRGCLEFSNSLKIPLFLYTKTMKATIPSMRRVSKKAKALDAEGTSLCKVDIERRYFRSDDPDKEVEEDQRVKAYRYGCTVVPFNEVDEKMHKFDGGVRGMKVLAFIPKASIRKHHLLHGTVCMAAPPGDSEAPKALTPLLQALYETNMVVLIRLTKRNYSEPVLAVAWPHLTANKHAFYMNELPFREDLRQYDFKSFSAEGLSKDQLKATEQLISSMDLDTAGVDEDGSSCEALHPKEVHNPAIQYFNQSVRSRLLKPDGDLPSLDKKIAQSCCKWDAEGNVLAGFFRAAAPHIDRLKTVMNVKVVEESAAKAKKRTYWFANGTGTVQLGAGDAPADAGAYLPPAKRAKQNQSQSTCDYTSSLSGKTSLEKTVGVQEGIDLHKVKEVVNRVTTITPTADFKAMVSRKDGDFVQKAVEGMVRVIMQLLQDSIGDQLHEKAERCVVLLRETCIEEAESADFNLFLHSLKHTCAAGRKAAFWARIQRLGLSLITSTECQESDISPEDAAAFIRTESTKPQPAAAPQLTPEDDLFDALD